MSELKGSTFDTDGVTLRFTEATLTLGLIRIAMSPCRSQP
jgi:hypothetical protein